MDPIATLRELLDAVLCHDMDAAIEFAEALQQWLRRGGFSPFRAPPPAAVEHRKDFPTVAVQRWLTGDPSIQRQCVALAQQAIALAPHCGQVQGGDWHLEDAPRLLLADRLKELLDGRSPLRDEATVYSELLGSALYEVDWNQLATAFLKRVRP